ncbi:MAG: dipeptidase [Thermomicrobiales bacterium]|nr:dipeptidase [Thermomicrobiales bacterium]
MSAYEHYLQQHEERHLSEVSDAIRLASVSALPAHKEDIRATAEWLAGRMRAVGVPEVGLIEGGGHPLVYGRWIVDPAAQTAMVYGHYDVQPPDPLDLWQTGPFEPTVRDGNLYGRGAADNKGMVIAVLQAVEALVQTTGAPPVNLVFFFEGEEEIGSPTVPAIVRANREKLAADVVISADGVMYAFDKPSLTLSTKGMLKGEIHLRTAKGDLHSGLYGAATPNAVQSMAQLLATLHTPEGAVAVEGFYDRARPLSDTERTETAEVPFDETAFLAETGAKMTWGEPGYTVLERLWLRPQLDLNGMWGGFQGSGSKTVTPCEAHAKFTCRLVAGQQPAEILTQIQAHVAKHCPAWATAEVVGGEGSSDAFEIRRDHPTLLAAAAVIEELYGKAPLNIRLGGTLPIAEVFQKELDAEMVFFSWEQADNNLHAPNEFIRLADLAYTRLAWCGLLTRLAGKPLK